MKYLKYSLFEISNEADRYRLKVANYSGTAGDVLEMNNGMKITIKDVDNDSYYYDNCAKVIDSWWYKQCTKEALNHNFQLHSNTSHGVT